MMTDKNKMNNREYSKNDICEGSQLTLRIAKSKERILMSAASASEPEKPGPAPGLSIAA